MSSALSAARNRRAPVGQNEPQNMPPSPYPSQNAGLTLPQVITLVDKRLITLEQFMKEQTESPRSQTINTGEVQSNLSVIVDEFNSRYSILAEEIDAMKKNNNDTPVSVIVDEFNSRYSSLAAELNSRYSSLAAELNSRYSSLAEEIDTMKNMLMKLQSFTMEVNKTLLDERIRIFSDVDTINTSLDMKRNVNFDKIENINEFAPKMDYLEQTGEFSMSNEFANYNNESKGATL
jgi:uncharacterized small protein (DUF1192 family)